MDTQAVCMAWDEACAPAVFAVGELQHALRRRGIACTPTAGRSITLTVADDALGTAQGFTVDCDGVHCRVTGSDAAEVMYGALDLADQLRRGHDVFAVRHTQQQPFIRKRGVKFNIPLDARTPGYDDTGDAAQRNIAEMWNLEFWFAFFDQMARDRYNMISFWNPHPFPSMVSLPDYPEVALDDVCVTTLTPNGRENEWGEPQLVSENVMANLTVVRRMSIDEKIIFWRAVMHRAKARGIAVYFITWNICPNSVARPVKAYYRTYDNAVTHDEPPGKYGVTHELTNPATRRYMRAAVAQFIRTYPDLEGFGITAGEHMPLSSDLDREKWLWDTYGEGIADACREEPGRKVAFLHRMWNTDLAKIVEPWRRYPGTFDLGFKYAKARLYSSPELPFARQLIDDMKPYGLKAWWNLRNDDIFVHRWGDPDYVRAFLSNFDLDATAGYHMGSDGYVWGREFVSKTPKAPRELEIDKHWYAFMLWGRLGYDPTLGRVFFVEQIGLRFPDCDAARLYDTWQAASQVIPQINCFYWRDWDYMWSAENSNSHGEGFQGVAEFCDNTPLQGSGIDSVREHVRALLAGRQTDRISPHDVAAKLDSQAARALKGADALRTSANDADLHATLDDCVAMGWLGHYYADKIRAAVALAHFQVTGDTTQRDIALRHTEAAYEHCTRYVDHSQARYHPQMLARSGPFDWSSMLCSARKDIHLVALARSNANRA